MADFVANWHSCGIIQNNQKREGMAVGIVVIGAVLAASVIVTSENICPRFLPRELDWKWM